MTGHSSCDIFRFNARNYVRILLDEGESSKSNQTTRATEIYTTWGTPQRVAQLQFITSSVIRSKQETKVPQVIFRFFFMLALLLSIGIS